MQVPVQITIRNIERSEALEARIREKVQALERFHSRITSCRVTVDESDRHRHQGRRFEVRIDIRVPGRAEVVATRHADEDVYVALREALGSATRQLEEVVREMRGDVKHHEPPQPRNVD